MRAKEGEGGKDMVCVAGLGWRAGNITDHNVRLHTTCHTHCKPWQPSYEACNATRYRRKMPLESQQSQWRSSNALDDMGDVVVAVVKLPVHRKHCLLQKVAVGQGLIPGPWGLVAGEHDIYCGDVGTTA